MWWVWCGLVTYSLGIQFGSTKVQRKSMMIHISYFAGQVGRRCPISHRPLETPKITVERKHVVFAFSRDFSSWWDCHFAITCWNVLVLFCGEKLFGGLLMSFVKRIQWTAIASSRPRVQFHKRTWCVQRRTRSHVPTFCNVQINGTCLSMDTLLY